MNRLEIASRRLHNQGLWGVPSARPEEALRRLGAMQAQEFQYAKWSLAQRSGDPGVATIDDAFGDGRILRTHLLRPTWHFVTAGDIRWMLEVTAPRVHALNTYMYRQTELDRALLNRSAKLIARALAGGQHLTRKEVGAVLGRAGIVASGVRLGYILINAELNAVICSGAMRGKQQTYALLAERAPRAMSLDRDVALAELTRRYFVSRGPATLKDYLGWSSLTAAEGRRGLEMVKAELEQEVVEGRTYWFAPSARPADPPSPVVDMVQIYDEYVMGYSDSRDILHEAGSDGPLPFAEMPYFHAILIDGHLVGHWRHTVENAAVTIDTFTYRALKAPEKRALAAAVGRYGGFLGLPATIRS
ncbi:MAG: winged helix DNA-binding domain-containing protein [Candidatus Dormiibacterota bacterium]